MSIRCTGTATAEFPADTAAIRIRVTGRHPDAERAYRTRQEGRETVRAVVAAASGVGVRGETLSENDWDGETTAMWECEAVASGEFAGLREIVSRLAAVPVIALTGPEWTLSPEGRRAARDGLLRDAVRSARREAELLVDALGETLGPLLHIRGGDSPRRDVEPRMMALAADHGALPPRTLELDLDPGMLLLGESVEVEFGIA